MPRVPTSSDALSKLRESLDAGILAVTEALNRGDNPTANLMLDALEDELEVYRRTNPGVTTTVGAHAAGELTPAHAGDRSRDDTEVQPGRQNAEDVNHAMERDR